MPIQKRTRAAQYPLVQEFVFNYSDGVPYLNALNAAPQDLNPRAVIQDMGSKVAPTGLLSGYTYQANALSAAPTYVDMFSLPQGAEIIGGDVVVESPYVGPSSVTLAIGDPQSSALYFTAATLMATAFTNQPTTLTNAGTDPTVCTMGNATANGVTAVGQTITVTGCTGASAAYNGTFIVDSYSTTSVVFTNPALTTSLTLAGTIAANFAPVRAALLVPSIASAGSPSGAQDASAGKDIRGTLTFGNTTAATAGRVRVRVMYTIDGRNNEASPN
jgi:hypothetical protein